MFVDLLRKFGGGVVAHLLLTIVHGSHFQNHCQVTARSDGNGQRRNLDAQNIGILVFQTQTVIGFAVPPGNDVDNQVNISAVLDGSHTEELGHVDDADTAQLDIVADQLRRGAETFLGGNLLDLHGA